MWHHNRFNTKQCKYHEGGGGLFFSAHWFAAQASANTCKGVETLGWIFGRKSIHGRLFHHLTFIPEQYGDKSTCRDESDGVRLMMIADRGYTLIGSFMVMQCTVYVTP